ncbi:MAG: hypothetical protein OHK0037_17070 [Elainellaceae cyanobacterium]
MAGMAIAACPVDAEPLSKITFDLAQISPEGLVGPLDGRRSLRYEFCIPRSADHQTAVQAINPAIEFYPNSPGRIGCGTTQILCIGETHHPNWRETLLDLARLDYVERIDEFYGE